MEKEIKVTASLSKKELNLIYFSLLSHLLDDVAEVKPEHKQNVRLIKNLINHIDYLRK